MVLFELDLLIVVWVLKDSVGIVSLAQVWSAMMRCVNGGLGFSLHLNASDLVQFVI